MFYFIGQCLILDEYPQNRGGIIEEIEKGQFSWELFVQLGSHHLVLPALYVKLLNAGLLSYLPDELVLHLKEIFDLNSERNRRILNQVGWLVNLFSKSNIHPVFLKGAGALLDGLYAYPGERVMNDIDCLVSDNDFDKAVQLLKKEGYSSPAFHSESLPMMHHYPSLFKPHEPATLEIHRYPVGKRQLKYLNVKEMKSQLFSSDQASKSLTLKLHDQVMINFIHSQLKDHGQYYANVPLRNIYEFYRLSLRQDLSEMDLQNGHTGGIFNNYMALAAKIFSPATQFPYKDSFRSKRYIARLERNKSNRFWYRVSKVSRTIANLLHSYLYISFHSLYVKDYRNHLRVRLSDRSWYKRHFSIIRSLIS